MNRVWKIVALGAFIFISSHAFAGVMELSASYGQHTSYIDQNNYTSDESVTASFAWYFLSQSAIELSYTDGFGSQSLEATGDPTGETVYYQRAQMVGIDLVLSLTPGTSMFQPFIRGGGAYLFKKLYEKFYDGTTTQYGDTVNTYVPSYGGGINIHLTPSFGLKFSYDRWESGVWDEAGIWDDSFRAGISWFF